MSGSVLKSTAKLLTDDSSRNSVSYNEKHGDLKIGKKQFKVFDLSTKHRHYMLIVPKIKNVTLVPDVNLKSQMEQLVKTTKFKSARKGKDLLKQVGVSINCIHRNPCKPKGRGRKVAKHGPKMRCVKALLARCHGTTPKKCHKKRRSSRKCHKKRRSSKKCHKRRRSSKKCHKKRRSSSKCHRSGKRRSVSLKSNATKPAGLSSRVKCSFKKAVKSSPKKAVKCSPKKAVKSIPKKAVKSSPKKAIAKQVPKSSSLLSRCATKRSQSKSSISIRPGDIARIKKAGKAALKSGAVILRSK